MPQLLTTWLVAERSDAPAPNDVAGGWVAGGRGSDAQLPTTWLVAERSDAPAPNDVAGGRAQRCPSSQRRGWWLGGWWQSAAMPQLPTT